MNWVYKILENLGASLIGHIPYFSSYELIIKNNKITKIIDIIERESGLIKDNKQSYIFIRPLLNKITYNKDTYKTYSSNDNYNYVAILDCRIGAVAWNRHEFLVENTLISCLINTLTKDLYKDINNVNNLDMTIKNSIIDTRTSFNEEGMPDSTNIPEGFTLILIDIELKIGLIKNCEILNLCSDDLCL